MTQETLNPSWQKLAMAEMAKDQDKQPEIRVSNSGKCPRALVYIAQGLAETDPPDEQGRNRMALGHLAEALVITDLKEKGWETAHTVLDQGQLTLEIPLPGTDHVIRGHPDGLCRHPDFTRDRWVTLEVKSMSPSRAGQVEQQGIAAVYPSYMAQISVYALLLHHRGLASHPLAGVFAIIDREGKPRPPERVRLEDGYAGRILEGLAEVIRLAGSDRLPERPYEAGSWECNHCSFHTKCRGSRAEPAAAEPPKAHDLTDDPQAAAAARQWLELNPPLQKAKRTLQEASDERNKEDVTAGGVTGGYFRPKETPMYDPRKLQELAPADLLRRCRLTQREKLAFWVRESR